MAWKAGEVGSAPKESEEDLPVPLFPTSTAVYLLEEESDKERRVIDQIVFDRVVSSESFPPLLLN